MRPAKMVQIFDIAGAMDSLLKQAQTTLEDYRLEMFRFRLKLAMRVPEVWKIFCDKFPDPSVVILVRPGRPDKTDDFAQATFDVIKPCDDVTKVVYPLVKEVRSWVSRPMALFDIPVADVEDLMDRLSFTYPTKTPSPHHYSTFVLRQKLPECEPLPEGFTLRPLDHTAPYMDRITAHQDFVPGKTAKYIYQDYVHYLPSAGIFNRDDELCAHMLTNPLARLANLYVETDYRRRGLATHLITHLTKCVLDEGYFENGICIMNAYTWNEETMGCFRKLGYDLAKDPDRRWLVIGEDLTGVVRFADNR